MQGVGFFRPLPAIIRLSVSLLLILPFLNRLGDKLTDRWIFNIADCVVIAVIHLNADTAAGRGMDVQPAIGIIPAEVQFVL